jgi:glycosyltransferase involved in cell wall biosynthesis
MAGRLRQLYSEPSLGKIMGQNAREYVREKYTISRMLKNYYNLYNSIA